MKPEIERLLVNFHDALVRWRGVGSPILDAADSYSQYGKGRDYTVLRKMDMDWELDSRAITFILGHSDDIDELWIIRNNPYGTGWSWVCPMESDAVRIRMMLEMAYDP